jgi:hypothetical protein
VITGAAHGKGPDIVRDATARQRAAGHLCLAVVSLSDTREIAQLSERDEARVHYTHASRSDSGTDNASSWTSTGGLSC